MTWIGRLHEPGRQGRTALLVAAFLMMPATTAPASAAAGWTGPLPVGSWEGCSDVVTAIDGAGGYHVAAECREDVRYASSADGSWSTRVFARPRDSFDLDPQIAIDGNRAYVAYSRETPATCGIDYLGVFYRWRNLPNGRWSPATRLGNDGDSLQSFRVVDGKLHATVGSAGIVYYETNRSGTLKRYPLSDAVGSSSLRISNDGTARIVYEAARSLRYARFHGSGFDTSSIPGTTADDRKPALVLDAQDHAHVGWTRTGGADCGDEEPQTIGTYYATDQGGSWTAPAARRVTADLGQVSLTVDTGTRRVHLLVGGGFGVKYYTKTPTGAWRGQRLSSFRATGVAIRLDPASGKLLVVYAGEPTAGVSYLTRP